MVRDTVFGSEEHKLKCHYCNECLDKHSSSYVKDHHKKCIGMESDEMIAMINNVVEAHTAWKDHLNKIEKVNAMVDNGEKPTEDGFCVCWPRSHHDKMESCKREMAYRHAASIHYIMVTNKFTDYLAETIKLKLYKIKIHFTARLGETDNSNARKALERNMKSKMAQEKSELERWMAQNLNKCSRDLIRMRDNHCDVHRYFDSQMDKIPND